MVHPSGRYGVSSWGALSELVSARNLAGSSAIVTKCCSRVARESGDVTRANLPSRYSYVRILVDAATNPQREITSRRTAFETT